MANYGSPLAMLDVINSVESLMTIREGQIKCFMKDSDSGEWVPVESIGGGIPIQILPNDPIMSTLASDIIAGITDGKTINDAVILLGGTLKTSIQAAIPTGTNEIGGVNVTKIGGVTPDIGAGNLDAATLRVAVATDDTNLSAINTALDIKQSALRDGIRGTGDKTLTTLETAIGTLVKESGGNLADIKTAITGTLDADVDVTTVGGETPDLGTGNVGDGTLRVAVATDDVNLSAIKTATEATRTATEAAVSRDALDQIGRAHV